MSSDNRGKRSDNRGKHMNGRFGKEHNKSIAIEVTKPDGTVLIFPSQTAAAEALGVTQPAISMVSKTNQTQMSGPHKGWKIRSVEFALWAVWKDKVLVEARRRGFMDNEGNFAEGFKLAEFEAQLANEGILP